jgi:hypothetical protein
MTRATARSGLFAFFILASLTTFALAQALDALIRAEVESKQLPAVSIAVCATNLTD